MVENALSAASSAAATLTADALLDFPEELAGDLGFAAGRCVEGDWDGMGDGFLIACQIRDHGVKGGVAEMLAQFLCIAPLVMPALLVSGNQVAEERQSRIVFPLDVGNGLGDFDKTLCAPVRGFQGNDDVVGGAESGEADKGKPRRAIDQNVVVIGRDLGDEVSEVQVEVRLFPRGTIGHVARRKSGARWQEINRGELGRADEFGGVRLSGRVKQGGNVRAIIAFGKKAFREVRLGIRIDGKDLLFALDTDAGEQPGGMRFADTTLEVDDGDCFGPTNALVCHANIVAQYPAKKSLDGIWVGLPNS